MTTTDPQSVPIDIFDKRPGRAQRLREWFWRGATLRAAKSIRAFTKDQRTCAALAQASCRLADGSVTDSIQARPDGRADPVILSMTYGLYRESVLWGLRVQPGVNKTDDLAEAFLAAPRRVLEEVAQGADALKNVEQVLLTHSTTDFAFLDEPTQRRDFDSVAQFARDLSKSLIDVREAVTRAWIQRLLRVGLVALVVMVGTGLVIREAVAAKNLAAKAHWRASSSYQESPIEGTGFSSVHGLGSAFFSTKEEAEPWIEFDLGKPTLISTVTVVNRPECCQERAIPLVVETSSDQVTYTEVGRALAPFEDWTKNFAPVTARYVRLRIDRKSYLHLKSVSIH